MAKPATHDEFSGMITTDFTWRLRELSNLKLSISNAGPEEKPTFLRALVVMCYAHWEGHAKYCGDKFIEFLTMRRLRFSELSRRFYEIRFIRELGSADLLNYSQRIKLVDKISSSTGDRFSHFPRDLIDTRSNLGSGLIDYSQKMTVAAIAMAEKKVWAHRS